MVLFAAGKRAFGYCDRCGQRYPLHDLKKQIYNQRPIGIKVCNDCRDVDHPQLQLGKYPVIDPIALREPRPEPNLADSRALFGWIPIEGLNNDNPPNVPPIVNIAGTVGNNAVFMTSALGQAFVYINGVET